MILVAIGLRARRRVVARRTAIASLVFAGLAGFVLVMQIVDPNETVANRMVQVAAICVFLAACAVEAPAFGSSWPPDPGSRE